MLGGRQPVELEDGLVLVDQFTRSPRNVTVYFLIQLQVIQVRIVMATASVENLACGGCVILPALRNQTL